MDSCGCLHFYLSSYHFQEWLDTLYLYSYLMGQTYLPWYYFIYSFLTSHILLSWLKMWQFISKCKSNNMLWELSDSKGIRSAKSPWNRKNGEGRPKWKIPKPEFESLEKNCLRGIHREKDNDNIENDRKWWLLHYLLHP